MFGGTLGKGVKLTISDHSNFLKSFFKIYIFSAIPPPVSSPSPILRSMEPRTCTTCSKTYPAPAHAFYPSKRGKGKLTTKCKACYIRESSARYHQNIPSSAKVLPKRQPSKLSYLKQEALTLEPQSLRRCRGCEVILPLDRLHFAPKSPSAFQQKCRVCQDKPLKLLEGQSQVLTN